MRIDRRIVLSCLLLLPAVPAIVGCSGSTPEGPAAGSASQSGNSAAAFEEDDDPLRAKFGVKDMPFKVSPPLGLNSKTPIAEIDVKAQWQARPVADAMKLLREWQQAEKPPVTTAEALKLVNDSNQTNREIVKTLGRLPTSDGEVNWDATLTRHLMGDVKSMNPLMQSSTEEFDVVGLMGIGFFSFDWNLKPFADEAFVKSWQTSADGLIDKVVMRDDLTWSDGKPVTAHDVVFSYKMILDERIPIPAVRSGTDKIADIVAVDDHTVLYFHKEQLAANIWNVNFPLIPKHTFEVTIPKDFTLVTSPEHVKLEENPVCGGMYTLSRRTSNQEIVLERRESYYMHNGKQVRDKPYFKTIRFLIIQEPATALLAIKKGDLDEMVVTPEIWTTQTAQPDFYANCTKARGVEWGFSYIGWNMEKPMFRELDVRRALAYAMDYDELLNKLCYGLYQPCSGIFYPTAWMYPKTPTVPYHLDLDKAEELLDKAGWKDSDNDGVRDKMVDGKLVKFEFTLLTMPLPLSIDIATLMKEQLEKIGITCNVQRVERTDWQQRMLDKRFDASLGGWGTGADPSTIDNLWKTGEKRNFTGYSNKNVDQWLIDGEKEFDRAKQAEIYAKIHTQIYEDQPYCFLYYRSSFYAFNKQLRGYVFSPRGPYHYGPGMSSIWRVQTP